MKKKTTFILMAFVMSLFTLTSCSDDDNTTVNLPTSNTIADFVAANPDFSSLGAALDRAGLTAVLDGSVEYTVFAPNNAAFDAFLQANGFANLEAVPVDVLTQVLLNHVVSGTNTSTDLATGYIETLAEEATTGNNINMYVNTADGVLLNGTTSVNLSAADIDVDNGVIHAVNSVISLPTVVTFATADSTFGSLVAALTRENTFTYVATLSTTGSPAPFTVFAPTDQAFADLVAELDGVNSLADIPTATLEATLNTHVVAGSNVLSTSLMNDMMVSTLGDSFTINTTGGATFTDLNGRTGNIIVTDVQAVNGVIHAIDKVILPNLN
ncbi:putative surface protein with fasciclin (FAS1) repeats [Kordia periserrulae]|uniref:Putative surface protein with fasciclin (FAS1) repeats n=1 Tax=Kordia periserrulae TaxID=701523 RepID=A0A2T6C1I1_9FLAO|nr:fasciclin domain-containing protein [Kordia periserrulae]PTX62171.1 putative surface protein with fasciclin (FAS1) repeats [Kordia periserrulae]